jgi:threonine synthase
VASNFERYLYYYFDKDTERLNAFMQDFQRTGIARIEPFAQQDFLATAVDTAQTLAAVKQAYEQYGYVLDPHTAVGYAACQRMRHELDGPLVCIATAHPAKFPDAVRKAAPGAPVGHATLDALSDLPQRKQVLTADVESVKAYLRAAKADSR